ncbi:hypothetical protein BDZ94DRAFT_1254956 [Collybia nuda]|uniref:Alpha/beta hydrolase fold-3 domain-containing protein n=1 Tax=Collybia nuda TaxID=64659 RepID=A0A9P6CG85_9AGAR|nr:hypothetical protein BDZ94DRAFT_1254956 [Collybia nuda]
MPVNALTTEVGLRVGPVILETLIKHYFDRLKGEAQQDEGSTRLRQDELLYDQVFNVVKTFLYTSSFHTVEDVQGFANTRTPSPPWVHVIRTLVPMDSCDEAAVYLVKALGGENEARRVVGGVKWWQVRGIRGVDAQWITAKKDWQDAKRRYKMQEKHGANEFPIDPPPTMNDSGTYEKEMDGMRCILYSHGGGYYFGSVDQERYSIQRHARKINGRVFAVNYRLAPQYPFPCALQDLLAAYLFLIKPPADATHCPVDPRHIVIAGDSAGGGISLALLQIIRDSSLPMPAGGVLISPWCDLTHSFPSVHTNTATDVIPPWGLSLQKPSILWPPPSDEISNRVHASLRSKIRHAFRIDPVHDTTAITDPNLSAPVNGGPSVSPPLLKDGTQSQTISLKAKSGETLTIDQQVHLYAQNTLLPHPLISPVLSYLGGLPPLLVIASDKEVLRDEIIYTAHKAANPEKYPIKEETRMLYHPLQDIENRYKPTKVHLQVYDDTAHVLPVLFSFTTPAKFCFRAIATFCKHVTRLSPSPPIKPSCSVPNLTPRSSLLKRDSKRGKPFNRSKIDISSTPDNIDISYPPPEIAHRNVPRRSLSSTMHRAASMIRPKSAPGTRSEELAIISRGPAPPLPHGGAHREISTSSNTSSDVGGPRFRKTSLPTLVNGERTAGECIYTDTWDSEGYMIRERVSTQGIIRSLEPEDELQAFHIHPETIGSLSELSVRRYIDARADFDKRFSSTIKTIEKHRRRNLEHAKDDTQRSMGIFQHAFNLEDNSSGKATECGIAEGLRASSGSWGWAWALDENEHPPPSSIVSRRDTMEARRLAKIADQSVLQNDQSLSGNNFWSAIVNFLTVTPDRHMSSTPSGLVKRKSRLSRFLSLHPTTEDDTCQ